MADNAGDDFDGVTAKSKIGIISNPSVAAFGDPSGAMPRATYHGKSSVNKKAIGEEQASVSTGGPRGDRAPIPVSSQYGSIDVKETKGGHLLIFDDTASNEKVILKHSNGSGFEMRPDGSIILKSSADMIIATNTDGVWTIEGSLKISANSLTLDVATDFNLTVGGDYNIKVAGDKSETIEGDLNQAYNSTVNTTVKGNESKINLASITNVILGSFNKAVKGIFKLSTEGSTTFSSKGKLKASSAESVAMSSPDINIAATSLSVFGDTGTIGGENMQMYTMNLRAGGTVYADVSLDAPKGQISRIGGTSAHYTTFHGDLNGTAKQSNITAAQNYPDTDPGGNTSGSAYPYTVETADDMSNNTAATALPDADTLTEYLTKSANGIARVSIDPGGYLKNMVDRSEDTGNVTTKNLNVTETRRKMRDPAHSSNDKFTAEQMASGNLSAAYKETTPPSIGRTRSKDPVAKTVSSPVTSSGNQAGAKAVKAATKPVIKGFFVDPQYDPMRIETNERVSAIRADTPLAKGITIGTFLGGAGDKTTLAHIPTLDERLAIARQFIMQADVLKIVRNDQGKFKDYRLVVIEGLYKKGENETLTPNELLDLATKGRVVVYELFGPDGKSSPDMLWDFAAYITDFVYYDKMILDYDRFDPSGELNAQLIIVMPEVGTDYSCTYANKLETKYNNAVQSTDDLAEILKDP